MWFSKFVSSACHNGNVENTSVNCFMNGFIETKNHRLLETRNYSLQVKLETMHYRTPYDCVIRTSISKQQNVLEPSGHAQYIYAGNLKGFQKRKCIWKILKYTVTVKFNLTS